jgi:DNA-binding transcriptional ArsR family regulator
LTKKIVGDTLPGVFDVTVIEDAAAAEASLDPVRARLLAELAQPSSATMLAARVGLARQKVNYHLRALERHGLVELVEERRKGNMTERLLRATAVSYVISPAALAALAPDPSRSPDRLSARWMLALAARLVRDVGALITGGARTGKRVATYGLDAEVRFASATDRAAFAAELTDAIVALVGKYHDETAKHGRDHRVIVAVHPSVKAEPVETDPKEV